jgi:AraC-like DNA-binding protein
MGRIDDPDAIARIAERDPREAVHAVASSLSCSVEQPQDWPDILAEQLRSPRSLRLSEWARDFGLAPGSVSRGFRKVYGVSAVRFRWEARARHAWRQIVGASTPLAEIAVTCGFADQAHMCRAVRAVTGAPPAFWRRAL